MKIGNGIAIAGIWVGVGMTALGGAPEAAPMVALFAFLATCAAR